MIESEMSRGVPDVDKEGNSEGSGRHHQRLAISREISPGEIA